MDDAHYQAEKAAAEQAGTEITAILERLKPPTAGAVIETIVINFVRNARHYDPDYALGNADEILGMLVRGVGAGIDSSAGF